MKRRLRPVRSHRRVRFRFTWPTLVLPILGLVLLARGDGVRAPLAEREAALAIAAQPSRGHLAQMDVEERTGTWTPATVAAVSAAPRLLSSGEFHLRLPGLVSGAIALGVAVVLGERLFATRIGILAAALILALPPGRRLLGAELGGEPIYLAAMLTALAAIRDMSEARASAIVAGVASGIAIAIGGRDGLWLPVFAVLWLRMNHGLTARSFAIVVASALASVALVTVAAELWLGRWASPAASLPAQLAAPQLARTRATDVEIFWSTLPLLPVAALGAASLPSGWTTNESLRFIVVWVLVAAASFALGGSPLPAYVAVLYAAAMLAVWGMERSRRTTSIAAVALCAALAAATLRLPRAASEERALDGWAVRETGRFVWRTVPLERRVAASPAVQKRLAYYGRRPVDSLDDAGGLAGADYVIVTREIMRESQRGTREATSGSRPGRPPRLRMIAEFGPWIIARVVRGAPAAASATPPAEPEANAS
ncbi:MAG TPA: hypothetical protein VFD92_03980 [Candidatus Binatia bacterium]|nr:hypothetical protein [Candidatus Binatia bacterium]